MISLKGLEFLLKIRTINRRIACRSFPTVTAAIESTSRARRRKPPLPSRFGETLEDRLHRSNAQQSKSAVSRQYEELLHSRHPQLFVARDNSGIEISMETYMKDIATLSPWVGSPDAAIRKCLDIAKATSTDIHYDLGAGDGRLCFHAIDPPYHVQKSVGVDVDSNLIQAARNRVARRHPKPNNIEFIAADLMKLEDEKTRHLWEQIRDECTILTMFFVEDGLQKLKPYLERYLKNSKNIKIITIGYPMRGWKTTWEEVVLDLRINLYQMNNDHSDDAVFEMDDDLSEYSRLGHEMGAPNIPPSEEEFVPHEQKGPPPQILDYDPNDDVDYHWDDFDEDMTKDSVDASKK